MFFSFKAIFENSSLCIKLRREKKTRLRQTGLLFFCKWRNLDNNYQLILMLFNKKKALLTKHVWLILRDNKDKFDREFLTKQKLIRLM
jgi:hypothetical protein